MAHLCGVFKKSQFGRELAGIQLQLLIMMQQHVMIEFYAQSQALQEENMEYTEMYSLSMYKL
jgi:hypothetical protein